LALDVNAFAIKEQIRLAIAGIALVHMQELIRVNILFLYTKFKHIGRLGLFGFENHVIKC